MSERIAVPRNTRTVYLNQKIDGEELIVSTHVDSIQAMLISASRHPELELQTKGRLDSEEKKVIDDDLFKSFTAARAKTDIPDNSTVGGFPESFSNSEARTRLRIEESSTGIPFKCGFFSMNNLVSGLLSGRVSPNRLLVNFGGVTDIEIGSDVSTESDLEQYATDLKNEIHARQLGKVPVSILKNRILYPRC